MRVVKVLNRAARNAKYTLGHVYEQARGFGQKLDHYVDVGRRVASALAPAIEQAAGEHAKPIAQRAKHGIQAYEDLKNRVKDTDVQVQQTVGAVRKAVPELGL